MADQPQQPGATGRARGRSRGRGRATLTQPQPHARRPGEAGPPPTSDLDSQPVPGRGRSRGGASQVPGSGAQAATEVQPPPTEQMAALSMSAAGEGGVGGISSRSVQARQQHVEQRVLKREGFDKKGVSGSSIRMLTNCFELKAPKEWLLYQYHVNFSPEVENLKLRQGLLRHHTEFLGNAMAFDGMILFLVKKFPERVTTVQTQRRSDNAIVTITITLTNELAATSPTCIQVYNIIFRKVLGYVGMQQIGRHYFNPNLSIAIPQHNLQVWPGFITSILEYDQGILLMADVVHKVLRTDTVLDILGHLVNTKGARYQQEALRVLVGEIVLTSYNNKTYRVDDIQWEINPSHTFAKFDGTKISYADYYREAYSRQISDMNQPLLVSNPKKKDVKRGMSGPIYLIPELCLLTGLSDDVRSDFRVMKDLAQHTRIAPKDRLGTLTRFIKEFPRNSEANTYMSKWDLSFSQAPISIDGRVLPAEKIFQKKMEGASNQGFTYNPADAEWSRELRGKPLTSTVDMTDWLLIYTSKDQATSMDFQQTLGRVAGPMGIKVGKPRMEQLRDDRADSFVRCIKQNLTQTTQMVVCILPTNRKDRYDAIKKLCCLETPVPSQCIVGRTISKKQMLMSVCTKIAMQINCKLGGELWTVEIPMKGAMVIGIDSYHDSSQKGRSVGGFVATTNDSLSRFYSRCTFQHTGQELIDGLKVCMQSALQKYSEINGGKLPTRIFIYRDGVGDGQLPAVVEHELPQILDCLHSLGTAYDPKVSMIVVKKRINNRFFHVTRAGESNPPPGTVIDTTVTRPEFYDFFLVSQSVRQGTVTPTSYNVIWDTSGLRADHLQRLTYKLTHLYYNWPGTIRVPAPCLYAHKLSFLVGQSLHKTPNLDLADRLYYL